MKRDIYFIYVNTHWRAKLTDVEFIWDEEPGGNVEHLADNGLTPEDVIHALETVTAFAISRSSGRSAFYGYALDGRFMFVVYEEIAEGTLFAVTAYEVS